MARVGILSNFIVAFIKCEASEIPNEKKFSKKDKAKLKAMRDIDHTEEIESGLSSKSEELQELQFNVDEKTANQVAQQKVIDGKKQNQELSMR